MPDAPFLFALDFRCKSPLGSAEVLVERWKLLDRTDTIATLAKGMSQCLKTRRGSRVRWALIPASHPSGKARLSAHFFTPLS